MKRCEQELCPYWTGDGCACAVFDVDDVEQQTAIAYSEERLA